MMNPYWWAMFLLTYIKGAHINKWVVAINWWLSHQLQGGINMQDERLWNEVAASFVQWFADSLEKGPINTVKRHQDEGRGYWHVCGWIWGTCQNDWLSIRHTPDDWNFHGWTPHRTISENVWIWPTSHIWTMETSSGQPPAAIHSHEGSAQHSPGKVHSYPKTSPRMGTMWTTNRSKCHGHIGWEI